jgi:hypothetical protein
VPFAILIKTSLIGNLAPAFGAAKVLSAIEKAAKGLIEGKVGKYLTAAQCFALLGLADLGLNAALHNPGCRWGLNPPVSSSDLAM